MRSSPASARCRTAGPTNRTQPHYLPLLLSSWILSSTVASISASPTSASSSSLVELNASALTSEKKLHGRFIHLTDLHPDPYYLFNSSEAASCHTHKSTKGSRAGWWGTSVSDCDAPLSLLNSTFDWLEEHFKGKVDFVVWTGDNARHDIDTRFPRSMPEIYDLNRYISSRIRQTFGNKVPVVTSFGNNDIFPHNIMFGGPSAITSEFLKIWKHYIPEEHMHTFARGGYYSMEAIPNRLLLVSLNTLYFYENNKAVDGCPSFSLKATSGFKKKDDDPGTEELMWLEQQLLLARMRGMQVWLTGHVPATKSNWYEGCYSRYGELMLAFQDTIVGGLFGHMNVDHFSFIKAEDVLPPKRGRKKKGDEIVHAAGSTTTLLDNLLAQFQGLPKAKKTREKDFSVVNINPSVIPTYLPAVRVWEYNTTEEGRYEPEGWETSVVGSHDGWEWVDQDEGDDEPEKERTWVGEEMDDATESDPPPSILSRLGQFVPQQLSFRLPSLLRFSMSSSPSPPVTDFRKKKHSKTRPRRRLPRYSSPDAPGRSNRFLTPLGYTQYYLNLDRANEYEGYGSEMARQKGGDRPRPQWSIEYVTMPARTVAKRLLESASDMTLEDEEGEVDPIVKSARWPEEVMRAVEVGQGVARVAEMLREKDLAPYELEDLTLRSWLTLARRVAKGGKQWKAFQKRMFVSSGADG